jgi:hypothetical protein
MSEHHQLPAPDDLFALPRLLVQAAEAMASLLGYGPYVPFDLLALPCMQRLEITGTPQDEKWLGVLPARIIERTGVL